MPTSVIHFWSRVPLWIRSIITGFLAFAVVGSLLWTGIIMLIPAPWSLVVMAIVLGIYWKYMSGSWWPASTSATRAEGFRAINIPAPVWRWSLVAALFATLFLEAGLVVTFRILGFPSESWALGVDAHFLIWAFILMVSVALGAGIGAALGVALDNIGLRVGMGIAIGVAIGAAMEQRNKPTESE